MTTIQFLQKRPLWMLAPLSVALLLAGCGDKGNQPASATDIKAFNGGDGKMPADFQAKMKAGQQAEQAAAQQKAAAAAKQKAASAPAK